AGDGRLRVPRRAPPGGRVAGDSGHRADGRGSFGGGARAAQWIGRAHSPEGRLQPRGPARRGACARGCFGSAGNGEAKLGMAGRQRGTSRRRQPTKADLVAENARLRRALAREARRAADDHDHCETAAPLEAAREQQAATSEILRLIASSPDRVQPMLDAVVSSAARLYGANDVALLLVDGEDLRIAAGEGPLYESLPADFHFHLTRGSVAARAVIDRTTVHVDDLVAERADEFDAGRALVQRFGHRTILAVPLLREGKPVGIICAFRFKVRPFPAQQITLLETFASQAVIAIENVRLFKELQERNKDLGEALERQTATADILRVISQAQTDVQPVFEAIADGA